MNIRENPLQHDDGLFVETSGDAARESSVPGLVHKYGRLHLYLIKPSKYDDEGYIIRYWKGVLPSNTLSCLNGLSEDVRERGILGKDLAWEITLIDDTVQGVPYKRIIQESRRVGTKT